MIRLVKYNEYMKCIDDNYDIDCEGDQLKDGEEAREIRIVWSNNPEETISNMDGAYDAGFGNKYKLPNSILYIYIYD